MPIIHWSRFLRDLEFGSGNSCRSFRLWFRSPVKVNQKALHGVNEALKGL